MILRILYAGRQLYLEAMDDTMVFDGFQFRYVGNVEKIACGPLPPEVLVGSSPQNVYPVQTPHGTVTLEFETQWICQVLERGDTPPAGVVPIVLADNIIVNPPNGELICLVTCHGTDVQYIQVI